MRKEVIAIIYQHPNILLGMKKDKFGKGKYNGFGGGVEKGETLKKAVKRETLEEACIKIKHPKKIGKLLFQFESGEQDHLVYFFRVKKFTGTPKESKEMKPEWFDIKNIPYEKMWDDDRYWLPLLLRGKKFEGEFYYNKNFRVVGYSLKNKIEWHQ